MDLFFIFILHAHLLLLANFNKSSRTSADGADDVGSA